MSVLTSGLAPAAGEDAEGVLAEAIAALATRRGLGPNVLGATRASAWQHFAARVRPAGTPHDHRSEQEPPVT